MCCLALARSRICSLAFFRKEWEDKAAKLGSSFNLDKAASSINDDMLRRARTLHYTMFAGKSGKGTAASDAAKNPPPAQVSFSFAFFRALGGVACLLRLGVRL